MSAPNLKHQRKRARACSITVGPDRHGLGQGLRIAAATEPEIEIVVAGWRLEPSSTMVSFFAAFARLASGQACFRQNQTQQSIDGGRPGGIVPFSRRAARLAQHLIGWRSDCSFMNKRHTFPRLSACRRCRRRLPCKLGHKEVPSFGPLSCLSVLRLSPPAGTCLRLKTSKATLSGPKTTCQRGNAHEEQHGGQGKQTCQCARAA